MTLSSKALAVYNHLSSASFGVSPPASNAAYRLLADPKCGGDFAPLSTISFDQANLLIGELGVPVPLPMRRAPLLGAIPHVVGLRSDKQMGGIAARRVVAAVADAKAINRNVRVRQHKRRSVRVNPKRARVAGAPLAKLPVFSGSGCEFPLPALFRLSFSDLCPKFGGVNHGVQYAIKNYA